MTAKECRELRADEIAQLQEIVAKAKTDNRSLTIEEQGEFDKHDVAAKALLEQAKGYERIEAFENLDKCQIHNEMRMGSLEEYKSPLKRNRAIEDRNDAYYAWMTKNTKLCKRKHWEAAERVGIDINSPVLQIDWDTERRANTVGGNPSAGGNLVAVDNQLMYSVVEGLKAYGWDYEKWNTVFTTETGANLPIPTNNDTANVGRINPEYYGASGSTAAWAGETETDLTLGQYVMNSYKFSSDLVNVSLELLNDSAVNIAQFIGERLSVRIGRNMAAQFTNGLGSASQQPSGILQGCGSGWTTGSATALTYADINAFFHSVDPAYRSAPGFAWMFSDAVYEVLEGIVDNNGRPLMWSGLEGFAVQPVQTIRGKPFIINQAMPGFAAGNKCIVAGDMKQFYIRRIRTGDDAGCTLYRLNERNILQGMISFFAIVRADSVVVNPGNANPLMAMTVA